MTGVDEKYQKENKGMGDLKNAKLIYLKGILFLISGVAAAVLLLFEMPTLKNGLLLTIAIWCFCRAYYFAFYVIQHYIDENFKFAGLGSFVTYLLSRKKNDQK